MSRKGTRSVRRGRPARPAPPAAGPAPEAEVPPAATHPEPRGLPPVVAVLLPLGLALVAAAVVHAPALGTWFAQDDVSFIARARGIIPTPWSFARPLSEGLVWRALLAAFGLNPLPYHLFNFALHLANVALVHAIGIRLLGDRWKAAAAATIFGVSGIAFTPLHWISCLVELLVTTFSLAAFLMFLRGREADGRSALWRWGSAACVFAALLSKENAILLPVAFAVAHLRMGTPAGSAPAPARPRFGPLAPPFAAAALYAVAFLATLKTVHYVGSDAYAMSRDPIHVVLNLFTYLRWIVLPQVPVRDAFAGVDPAAWTTGFVVMVVVLVALWTQRRRTAHPEEVGVAWFLVLLAPVVPLASHTYLYYLYLPLAGACWFVVAFAGRLLGRVPLLRPQAAAGIAWGLVMLLTFVEFSAVRAREAAKIDAFAMDKTIRESTLLRNAVADLRAAGVTAGDTVAFMNPGPRKRVRLVGGDADAEPVRSYYPLEGAMRQGQSIAVFFPGAGYLGFGRDIPPEWERAKIFVFFDDGHLEPIGSGTEALAQLGHQLVLQERWDEAGQAFERSIASGDTLPDAAYGLIATDYFQGRRERAMARAAAFLRRWPDDPRVPALAQQLRAESLMVRQGR